MAEYEAPKKSKAKSKETKEVDYYALIEKKIEASESGSATWLQNQDKFHRLRMRIKKAKNFPFQGCSNIRMPTAETKIRHLKAALVNVIFGLRPVCQVKPTPSGNFDTAHKIEKYLDHLLMDIAKVKPKAVIAIDQELEKGFYIIKPYYRVEKTTRIEKFELDEFDPETLLEFFDPDKNEDDLVKIMAQATSADMSDRVRDDNEPVLRQAVKDALDGQTELSVKLKDVLYDAPDIDIISPENFYVPTDGGYDVQALEYCGHPMYKPLHVIKDNAIDKGWDLDALDEIEAMGSIDLTKSKLTMSKDMREGITRLQNPSQLVKIVEFYCWYDLDGDGSPEKCVFTCAPDFKKVLRKISLPLNNGKWPFVKIYYELIDDRWYSHRGIVELIEDIIQEIDIQHMQKLDQQTIRNTPMFVYRAGMVNPNTVQFIPNQGIPVHGMSGLRDTIDILNNNNPNVEFSYEKEEQILLGRIEELVGRVDYTLQSQINRRQPRTLGEVELQAQSQQNVFGLDASLHVDAFSELFQMMWDLECQYGPDERAFNYFGPNQFEPIKLTREESQGQYKIVIRGNDQNTNPQVRLQKAQAILVGATNPVALQLGVVGPQHVANAYRLFYNELDVQDAELYYSAQPQPPQGGPKLNELMKIDFATLTDGEKAQFLIQMGIKPDIAGRMLDKQHELADTATAIKPQPKPSTNGASRA